MKNHNLHTFEDISPGDVLLVDLIPEYDIDVLFAVIRDVPVGNKIVKVAVGKIIIPIHKDSFEEFIKTFNVRKINKTDPRYNKEIIKEARFYGSVWLDVISQNNFAG